EDVRALTKDGVLSAGHARALLAFENSAMISEAAKVTLEKNLTVREVEKMAKNSSKTGFKSPKIKRRDSFYDEVEISL
ncbi:hypothetical protein RFX70_12300, partial [Acinetobacter baumannii]|nr:hypothetical protein [Acinetobacter baumannii]